jgi:hypothetical protein
MLYKLPTFAEAEEQEIFAVMDDWPAEIGRALRDRGMANSLDDREAGHRLWQAKFAEKLAPSRDYADNLSVIIALAEAGHIAAQHALRHHINALLEDPEAKLPTSVRAYLVRRNNNLVPARPEDRSEVLEHFLRDLAIVAMVDTAALRWNLPKLNSSPHRRSAAYFTGVIMARHGTALGERQIRKIYQARAHLAQRMGRFLTGDQTF